MATWDFRDLNNETCSACRKEYKVKYQNLPLREKDSFSCSCGNEMRSWNETGAYTYEPIEQNQ